MKINDMRLTENFLLSEAEKSSIAIRLGIDNSVPGNLIPQVKYVAEHIVQPVRDHYGVPIVFNGGLSWFRSDALNKAIKGAEGSQHTKGEAVDLEVPGISNYNLARWIMQNLNFDQLILERHVADDPQSGWVHVSLKMTDDNRKQVLTSPKAGVYIPGLVL